MRHKIKENIDKMIGKKDIFTHRDKNAIYAKIEQNEENDSRRSRSANKLGILLAYTVAVALLLFFGWAGIFQNLFDPSPTAQEKTQTIQQGAGQQKETFPFDKYNGEKAYSQKHPDQFNIVKKMYYSLNYIDNAQGEYIWGHPMHGDSEHEWFYVDYNKKMFLTKYEEIQDEKVLETGKVLKKDGKMIQLLPKKKIYNEKSLDNSNPSSANLEDQGYDLRLVEKQQLGSNFVLNSEWVVFIRNNFTNWTYHEGTKFGMPVYDIKGVDHLDRPFTMTVSKETGALLDLKSYKKDTHELEFYITVKDIQINEGIKDEKDIFHLNLSGNKELAWDEFLPKTVGGQAFKGEKTGWDQEN